jgi:hypothetical protein
MPIQRVDEIRPTQYRVNPGLRGLVPQPALIKADPVMSPIEAYLAWVSNTFGTSYVVEKPKKKYKIILGD